MKVIQLNAWQGRLINEVVLFLKREDADFVCLQEVYEAKNYPIVQYDYIKSLNKIADELPEYSVSFSPAFTFEYGDATIGFGNAILSKTKPLWVETFETHGTFHHVKSWGTHDRNARNAIIARFEVESRNFLLINHHGYHIRHHLGDENSLKSIQKLADHLKKLPGPKILCGDLNVVAESDAMRPLDEGFENLTATHAIDSTLTKYGRMSDVASDHILVTPEIEVMRYETSEDVVSDHKPLVIEFDVKLNESR